MSKTRGRLRTLFMLTMLAILYTAGNASEALAGGFTVNGQSCRAGTMGNAFTAVADDPSAVFYNPAGLTQIQGTVFDGTFYFAFPHNKYTNSTNNVTTTSHPFVFAPTAFLSTPISDKIVFGFGFYSPYGRKTSNTANAAVGNMKSDANALRLDLVPTVAFQLGEYLSLGVSFVGSYVRIGSDSAGFDENGSGYGFTGQGGILLKPHKRFRVGVSFRGPMTSYVTGTGSFAGQTGAFTSDFEFPAVLNLGLAWQVIDKLLLAVEFDIEMWSRIDAITRKYDNPTLNAMGTSPLNADDSYDARFGLIYKPLPPLEIRFGYSFVSGALPANNMIPAQPDYDTHVLAVGFSQHLWRFRFDLGYEFNYSPTRTATTGPYPGNYSNIVHVISSGMRFQFGKMPKRPGPPSLKS